MLLQMVNMMLLQVMKYDVIASGEDDVVASYEIRCCKWLSVSSMNSVITSK